MEKVRLKRKSLDVDVVGEFHRWCREHGIPVLAQWYGRAGSKKMIAEVDSLRGIWDGHIKGSMWSVDLVARKSDIFEIILRWSDVVEIDRS